MKVFKEARELDFRTTSHAGEAAGAKSIWGAINRLRVDRIDHGTRAGEDESLLDYLAEKQIPRPGRTPVTFSLRLMAHP